MNQPSGEYENYHYLRGKDDASVSTWPTFLEEDAISYSNAGVTQADVDRLFARSSSSYTSVGGPKTLKRDREQKIGGPLTNIDQTWERSRASKGVK
jgi:hypothetical protein